MASYDRDYAREGMRGGGPPALPPVTKWLLILNVGIFILDLMLRPNGNPPGVLSWGPLNRWGCFAIQSAVFEGRIWEFFTFQFLHDSFLHVTLNSIGLYFFGPLVEQWWGARKFIIYYLLCGVGGAVFFVLLYFLGILPNASVISPLVGASAGLYGLLCAVFVLAPAARVRLLFPPIELTMKQMALALFVISSGTIIGGLLFPNSGIFSNEGGEAGHLGGAIMGFVLMKFPWLIGRGRREKKIIRPKEFRRRGAPKIKPRTEIDLDRSTEIDRILDKINEEGVASLTEAERETLAKTSRKDS